MDWFETNRSASKYEIPLTLKFHPAPRSRRQIWAQPPVSILTDLKIKLFLFSKAGLIVLFPMWLGSRALLGHRIISVFSRRTGDSLVPHLKAGGLQSCPSIKNSPYSLSVQRDYIKHSSRFLCKTDLEMNLWILTSIVLMAIPILLHLFFLKLIIAICFALAYIFITITCRDLTHLPMLFSTRWVPWKIDHF